MVRPAELTEIKYRSKKISMICVCDKLLIGGVLICIRVSLPINGRRNCGFEDELMSMILSRSALLTTMSVSIDMYYTNAFIRM